MQSLAVRMADEYSYWYNRKIEFEGKNIEYGEKSSYWFNIPFSEWYKCLWDYTYVTGLATILMVVVHELGYASEVGIAKYFLHMMALCLIQLVIYFLYTKLNNYYDSKCYFTFKEKCKADCALIELIEIKKDLFQEELFEKFQKEYKHND